MKHILSIGILAAGLAQPVAAFDQMEREDCQASIERLMVLTMGSDAGEDPENRAVLDAIQSTPEGWCSLTVEGLEGFEDAVFDVFEWRAQETTMWTQDGVPPLALQMRMLGFSADELQNSGPTTRPPLDVDVTWRQDPDAGLLILEHAEMSNGIGDVLVVSAVFERVFLSSTSMMQVSAGSAAIKSGLLSMTFEGTHPNPFGMDGSFDISGPEGSQSQAAFDVISAMPEGLMDDATRAEMMAFAADLPTPVGTIEMILASERGIGLMQIASGLAYSGLSAFEGDGLSEQFEVIFDGVSLSANWSPKVPQAD